MFSFLHSVGVGKIGGVVTGGISNCCKLLFAQVLVLARRVSDQNCFAAQIP